MIKQITLFAREAGISREEFRQSVIRTVGLILATHPETAAVIRHCHFTFSLPTTVPSPLGHPSAEHLDLLTEVYYAHLPDPETATRAGQDSDTAPLHKRCFAHCTPLVTLYTKEWPVLRGERTTWRAFCLRRRSPILSRPEFQQRWLSEMRLLLTDEMRPAGVAGYVQNLVAGEDEQPGGSDLGACDVIDEIFLTSPTALADLDRSHDRLLMVGSLEEQLLDPGSTRIFTGETVRIIP